MLSGKLIHLIEQHYKEISQSVIDAIRRHPEMTHLGQLPDAELRERGQTILANLGHWLVSANEASLARQQEAVGKLRFEQSIPMHEAVRGLCVIKEKMLDFLEQEDILRDSLGLYAEEELQRRVGRFFDTLVVHLVKGYETAWRHATHMAA
ncbi:MAG: hypothetical protein C5B51_00980 [Terriglobia bacterium]|nr:MAG: hypothetical protein C5B51_00980 [Terriglobia bacterium]